MASSQCISRSDITELRSILDDIKSNIYAWINVKHQNVEISDTNINGVMATQEPMVLSLGSLTYEDTNINQAIGDPDAMRTAYEIIERNR